MSRLNNTQDSKYQKSLKMIPSEIIGLYLIAVNIIPLAETYSWWAHLILAVAFLAITPLFLIYGIKIYKKAKEENPQMKPTAQVILTTIAFAIWVFAIGGPFQTIPGIAAYPWIGSILLTLWTGLLTMFLPEKAAAPPSPATPP